MSLLNSFLILFGVSLVVVLTWLAQAPQVRGQEIDTNDINPADKNDLPLA